MSTFTGCGYIFKRLECIIDLFRKVDEWVHFAEKCPKFCGRFFTSIGSVSHLSTTVDRSCSLRIWIFSENFGIAGPWSVIVEEIEVLSLSYKLSAPSRLVLANSTAISDTVCWNVSITAAVSECPTCIKPINLLLTKQMHIAFSAGMSPLNLRNNVIFLTLSCLTTSQNGVVQKIQCNFILI